ncbi:MAG: DUF4443 domain-containing protein [Candidatus Thorarchaeota archaeon]
MSWKEKFIQLVGAADGRVAPAFGPHHAAVALVMIGREQPLGRYELCQNLSVGEGSARTLLKRLTESGYISPEGKQGQRLTDRGQELFDEISREVPIGLFLDAPALVMYKSAYANLVRKKGDDVKDGIRQRDEAIIQGGGYDSAGATTLIMRNGSIVLPPDDFHTLIEYERETLLILESLRPEENDVIIIGSADDPNLAREVSMAAVMTLF